MAREEKTDQHPTGSRYIKFWLHKDKANSHWPSAGSTAFGSHTLRALIKVQFCSRSRKTIILTRGIQRVFRGLKFESEAEIGQKGIFLKLSPERMVHEATPQNPFFCKKRW